MKFALYRADGRVVATGECPDGMESFQARPGTSIWIGEAIEGDRVDLLTGLLVKSVRPEPTHRERRRYPSVGEQLDALWRAMDSGEIPKATEFYDMIKAAKDAAPDPEALKRVEL